MAYDDSFYYGQNKLICTSSSNDDNGKAVSVVSSSGRSFTGTMADNKCIFMLPPRDKYTVSIMNSGSIEQSREITLGYGECKELRVGLDKSNGDDLKYIVNNGLETQMFAVGDQVMFKENGNYVPYDVLHIDYRESQYGKNIIFGRHENMGSQQYAPANGSYWFDSSPLGLNLINSNMFDKKLMDNISVYEFMGGVADSNLAAKIQHCKIWLPVSQNVVGETPSGAKLEEKTYGALQFDYFKDENNRKKGVRWWTASLGIISTRSAVNITTDGIASIGYNADSLIQVMGVFPCFMIAAD